MPCSKTHINLLVALALMSSQQASATDLQHSLSSTTISSVPSDQTEDFYIFTPEENEKHIFSTKGNAHYTIDPKDNTVSHAGLINAFNSNVSFASQFDLSIDSFNVENLFGIILDNQTQTELGQPFQLSTTAHDGHATALSLFDSQLKVDTGSSPLKIFSKVVSTNDNRPNAIAIEIASESRLEIHGNAKIEALKQDNNKTSLGTAFSVVEQSTLKVNSLGNSQIIGNIVSNESSHIDLRLTGNHDIWWGDITTNREDDERKFINGDTVLSLTQGATWAPMKDNGFKTLFWGKDSVIDLSYTDKNVRLGLPGLSTDSAHKSSCTQIEDGAILKVRITDDHINHKPEVGNEAYLINVENAQAIGKENVQITVNVIDERTQKSSSEPLGIALIHFDKVAGGITLKSGTHDYETGLGKFQTITEFGSGVSGGFVINAIRTDLIGPSALTNNHLDFTSTEMIALERLGDQQLNTLTDRALFNPQKGLWSEVHYGKTETHFDNSTRKHDIKTASLIMGHDRELNIPFMNDSYAGALAYFSQNDIDLITGSAESNAYGIGVYAGGLSTEKNYRLLMQAYIGQTDSKLSTPGFIDGMEQKLEFDSKTKHYGVGFYMGFVQTMPENSPWFLEPFIAGQSYWMKSHETNEVRAISFSKPENQQSVVKLGTIVAYQCTSNPSNRIYTQLAWLHRFGKSVEVIGKEGSQSISFHTPDLQESWAEMTAGANWSVNDTWHLLFKTTMGYAENVKPRYDLNAAVTYVF